MREGILVIVIAVAAGLTARAAPGDKLYITADRAVVRTSASITSASVIAVNRGHELMEFQVVGNWIEVGVARTGGKTGWVRRQDVSSQKQGGKTTAPLSAQFKVFRAAFDQLNHRVEVQSGVRFFTGAEDRGDGILYVTATSAWLAGPRQARESNARTILELWRAANNDLPVMVYIQDSGGRIVMGPYR